jgi:IS605 OrfB family transposase
MIRKSTVNLSFSNKEKKNILLKILKEYNTLTNSYIDYLWEKKIFYGKFVKDIPNTNTFLSKRMQQCSIKQALSIVKSQRKKRKKTKPNFKQLTMELDSRFSEIKENLNSFDLWIKLGSIGNKIKLWIPSKKHHHFNKFKNWGRKKSIKIYQKSNKLYADIYFEKENKLKTEGKTVGFDIGYKKLLVDSNGNFYGEALEEKINKITRKQRKSKAFNRALIERNEYINQEIKKIDLSKVSKVIVEDLKNLKYKTKKEKKINKQFRSKQQYWVYPKILKKLELLSEENDVHFQKVNPAYSSQICSKCNVLDKSSRKKEIYNCKHCGSILDSDFNAAINILNFGLGKYGFQ